MKGSLASSGAFLIPADTSAPKSPKGDFDII